MRFVLIVDNDLGFAFWLGNAFDRAGDEAFPAKSIPDALELLKQTANAIDIIIVNLALRGFAGFLSEVSRGPARVIAVADTSYPLMGPPCGADLVVLKPLTRDERWAGELRETIRKLRAHGAAS